MLYPIIILGAGASYDYNNNTDYSLPLTKDLFHPGRYGIEEAKKKFPELHVLAAGANRAVVEPKEENMEDFLNRKMKIAIKSGNIELQKEFIAMEFYLRDLLSPFEFKTLDF